jgi:hypothetical protein
MMLLLAKLTVIGIAQGFGPKVLEDYPFALRLVPWRSDEG